MFGLYPDKAKQLGAALRNVAESTAPNPHRDRPASIGAMAQE
jgi:hypothetical protein